MKKKLITIQIFSEDLRNLKKNDSDFDTLFLQFEPINENPFICKIVKETIIFDIQNAQMDENQLPDSFK